MRVDVVYVLVHDSQTDAILLVENEAAWSLPGGKREYGETLQQAAVREVKEETGFDVTVDGLVHLSEKFIGDEHVMFITFQGTIIGDRLRQLMTKSDRSPGNPFTKRVN